VAGQRLDHRGAGAAATQTGILQGRAGVVRPGDLGSRRHQTIVAAVDAGLAAHSRSRRPSGNESR
jgi:hypothetical protein